MLANGASGTAAAGPTAGWPSALRGGGTSRSPGASTATSAAAVATPAAAIPARCAASSWDERSSCAAIASASIRFITPSSMPGGYGGGGAGSAGGGAFGGGSRSACRHSPSQTPRHGR